MDKKKGFDLGELLKDVSELDTGREQIEYIRLDLIDSDPNNFYQLSNIEQLADNISMCRLQQPIRVRPVPGGSGRYIIVSGHRRRAAVELLAKEDPERWAEVPCIVETDAASPSLQQLRLIYANANTRTMTPAEVSEQAVQVEKLLYQLKEEGYDFPGRMRDHVAQAVGASKTKLARLKMIRDNLAKCWMSLWKTDKLSESTAYELAQLSEENQQLIFDTRKSDDDKRYIHASTIECYAERFGKIEKLKCKKNRGQMCDNCQRKKKKAAEIDRWTYFHCDKCCSTCNHLASCRHACPKLADQAKKLRAENKEKRLADKAAQENRDRPTVDFIQGIYTRLGKARAAAKVSVKDLFDAQSRWQSVKDMEELEALEAGTAKVTTSTCLPFGYSFMAGSAAKIVAVADLLDCSIDYLLGRTEDMRPVSGWQTGNPWNFGEYVVLVRYDSGRSPTPEKMTWTEEGWEMLGTAFEATFSDATILGWMPMPEEDDDLPPAIDIIRETGVASVSMLQRKLKIGYAAASELMDKLEKAGIVGPYSGSQPREILIDTEVAEK